MSFWSNVEQECRYKGISRKELAAAAHFSVNTFSSGLKRGGMPAADLALRIAKALDTPLENLIDKRNTEITAENISEICKKQKLMEQYLPYIEKLEQMPQQTAKALLTIIDTISI